MRSWRMEQGKVSTWFSSIGMRMSCWTSLRSSETRSVAGTRRGEASSGMTPNTMVPVEWHLANSVRELSRRKIESGSSRIADRKLGEREEEGIKSVTSLCICRWLPLAELYFLRVLLRIKIVVYNIVGKNIKRNYMERNYFEGKTNSKSEIYRTLAIEGRFFLPPLRDATVQFLSQALLTGGAKAVKFLLEYHSCCPTRKWKWSN